MQLEPPTVVGKVSKRASHGKALENDNRSQAPSTIEALVPCCHYRNRAKRFGVENGRK